MVLLDAVAPERWHDCEVAIKCRSHEGTGFDLDDIAAWHVGFAAVFQSGQCSAGFARKDDGADDNTASLRIINEKYLLPQFARMTERRLAGRRCAAARSNGMSCRTPYKRAEFGKDFSCTCVNTTLYFFPVEEVLLQRFEVHAYHHQASDSRLRASGIYIKCYFN